MVQQALDQWCKSNKLSSADIFLFCCFFCNNQYRILIDGNGDGSDNLEETFEARLKQIGHVVALLDTWNEPRYLTRIWTIYEQFTAAQLGIEVTMILPPASQESLIEKLEEG